MLTSPTPHPHLFKGQIRASLSQQQPFCIQPCSGVPMRGVGAEVQDSSSPRGPQQMFNAARAKPFVNLIKSNGVCLLFQMLDTLTCIKKPWMFCKSETSAWIASSTEGETERFYLKFPFKKQSITSVVKEILKFRQIIFFLFSPDSGFPQLSSSQPVSCRSITGCSEVTGANPITAARSSKCPRFLPSPAACREHGGWVTPPPQRWASIASVGGRRCFWFKW